MFLFLCFRCTDLFSIDAATNTANTNNNFTSLLYDNTPQYCCNHTTTKKVVL